MTTLKSLSESLLISSPDEVEEFATELANDYVGYFDIDISGEQDRYQDSIEECLAHLEEVISALDTNEQNSETIDRVVDTIVEKEENLEKLFKQVDAIEQYAFETNQLLDQMDSALKDLERHQTSKDGRIKQLLHMIPGVASLPRFGLFSAIGNFVDETPNQDFVETSSENRQDQQLVPISEILERLKHIEAAQSNVSTNLMKRVYGSNVQPPKEVHEPMATLTLGSTETHEDGSWQELL